MGLSEPTKRVRALAETAAEGGEWYIAPESIAPGTFSISVACAPFGERSWETYEVIFDWTGDDYTTYVFDLDPDVSHGLGAMAGGSPWHGWAGWAGSELLVAWRSSEDEQLGASTIEGASPFDASDGETDSIEAWAELARIITLQLMR